MNIALWIVQGLLSAMFLMAGIMKMSQPVSVLRIKVGGWVDDVSPKGIKTIGLLEFLAGVGLVLPMIINMYPILTPLAAIGLVLTMIGASVLHIKRKEKKETGMNMLLMVLAIFVFYGRYYLLSPV